MGVLILRRILDLSIEGRGCKRVGASPEQLLRDERVDLGVDVDDFAWLGGDGTVVVAQEGMG